MNKKWMALILSAALAAGMSACSSGGSEVPGEPAQQAAAQSVMEEPTAPAQQTEPQQLSTETAPAEEAEPEAEPIVEPPADPEPEPEPVEADLFTDVNETVYATGTVNLRAGAGTQYEKVGSLSWGQAVTRTGIGTGEADGWSEVQLSDGRVVCVASSYISTTKPAAPQTSAGNSNQTTTSTPSQQSTPSQPAQSQPAPSQSSSSSTEQQQDLPDWLPPGYVEPEQRTYIDEEALGIVPDFEASVEYAREQIRNGNIKGG